MNLKKGIVAMASSAQELITSLETLQREYLSLHVPAVNNVMSQVDQHVSVLVGDGAQWISAETRKLESDWQTHRQQLNNVVTHFEGTAGFLNTVIAAVRTVVEIAGGE
jgi:hypothetical protein